VREWTLRYDARPLTLNRERAEHWRAHRESTREWRDVFRMLARNRQIPRLEAIVVEVVVVKPNRRGIPDLGGVIPSAKAAIDGLVDAGVLVNDTDVYVRALTFLPHRIEPGAQALELTIREVA
jgi:hypothetical protein